MRGRAIATILALVALAGCADDDDASNPATTAPDATTTTSAAPTTTIELPEPVLEERRCDPERFADVPDEVTYECSWLVVPERRDAFDGDVLRLAVTVLHSTASDPLPDPVVYLSGGPGGAGGSPRYWSQTPMIEQRDVIVYDQRGTGASEPDMECPEMEAAVLEVFGDAASYEQEAALVRSGVEACRDRLTDEGVDLEAFSTPASASDLADLRVALGYDEWNLLGVSYGTRLAQETLRSHPEGIRSVVLDSTYPTDEASVSQTVEGAQRALDQLATGCAADDECATTHGDLGEALEEIIARYDETPHRSTIDLGDDGGEIDIAITGSDIVAGLFTAMYDTELIEVLPTFATALTSEAGGGALIDQVAIQGIPRVNGLAEGMALSTNCSDGAPVLRDDPAVDDELLADPGRWSSLVTVFSTAFCEAWLGEDAVGVDESFAEPVTAGLPVLVLSGTYDPVTSTPEAQRVADALPNATFVTFDGIGHGVWDVVPCATDLLLAYLDDPATDLDTSCAAAVPPPDFG